MTDIYIIMAITCAASVMSFIMLLMLMHDTR